MERAWHTGALSSKIIAFDIQVSIVGQPSGTASYNISRLEVSQIAGQGWVVV